MHGYKWPINSTRTRIAGVVIVAVPLALHFTIRALSGIGVISAVMN